MSIHVDYEINIVKITTCQSDVYIFFACTKEHVCALALEFQVSDLELLYIWALSVVFFTTYYTYW